MEIREAKKMLQAKLECMKQEDLSAIGKGCDKKCDECHLNYEQGNRGEQKEAISVGIATLALQTPRVASLEGDGYSDGHLVYDTWICPNCESSYEMDYEEHKFCPNCGQKIDWEELRAMEKITVYKCDYCGKLIDTQEECVKHEQRHRNVEGANEMLRSGATLEDINQRYGIWYSVPEHLKNVTKDHCFTISYWQCCDKPAYTIKGIDMDGRLYVFGIGSWSGGYGCEVPIDSTNLKEVHSPDELFVDSRYGKGRW